MRRTTSPREGLWEIFAEDSGVEPLTEIRAVTVNGLEDPEVLYIGQQYGRHYYEARSVLANGRVVFSVQYRD